MGQGQFKCPAETNVGATPLTCVMTCPTEYELRTVDGAQRCVSKVDKDVSVHLMPQAALLRGKDEASSFTIGDLKDTHPDEYTRYTAEQDRFHEEMIKADSQVSHTAKVDAAAHDVLAAQGSDDTANAKYSALTKDPDALDAMYKAQIARETDKYVSQYQFLNNQSLQQQQTLDLVNSVKDNLMSVKDDMEFSVGTFDKQINEIRNQITINRRTHAQAADYGKWMSVLLNVLIVLSILYLLFALVRRAIRPKVPTTYGATPEESSALFGALTRWAASKPPS